MKRFIIISTMMASACLPSAAQDFARGADISWVTEMEADGRKFYNSDGVETDAFELMKQIGINAIRLRVFVDPEGYGYGPWCDKADVVAKARRAQAQELDLMIDFHYSDFFADPEQQNVPQAWVDYTTDQVKAAMVAHTAEVLQELTAAGISPKWVQVGNETNSGIALPHGPVEWDKSGADRFAKYVVLSNACYDAVKAACPDAYVIVHLGGSENARWFFPDFLAAGGKVDMIGLSHYPTEDEWNSSASTATHSNVNAAKYVSAAITDFGVPVMICETGFEVSKPALAQRVMIDLFNRLT
ncbi:MAG: glycosyl hydrolase 53 family protein, partial [Muribaculaceae bacterium]